VRPWQRLAISNNWNHLMRVCDMKYIDLNIKGKINKIAIKRYTVNLQGPSWSWSYGSWIYNYLCNQCISTLTLWVWILFRRGVLDTTLCDKVCQWLAAGLWFCLGTTVSSTIKTDRHDITEILLKVALNTINLNLL
jgi:hypothetical protein